jgi:hypothetical protein
MSHAPAPQLCNCGLRGWLPGVEHRPIRWQRPSYIVRDEGLMKPFVIVDHIMQGYLTTIDAWAVNAGSKIITHFGINRAGRIVQYQDIYTEGIHTSAVNGPTSKIVQQYGSVAHRGANPYSVSIEHEGFSVDPGYGYDYIYSRSRPWPEPMVQASVRVKAWIFAQPDTNLGPPSTDTIIGHYEADARNRINDPSPQNDRGIWPRDRMIVLLTPQEPAVPPFDRVKALGLVDAISRDTAAAKTAIDRIEVNSAEIRRMLEVK